MIHAIAIYVGEVVISIHNVARDNTSLHDCSTPHQAALAIEQVKCHACHATLS